MRFPHDRIIAVEILRGPDHIAMRTGDGDSDMAAASDIDYEMPVSNSREPF
jgi:hypothetical protein